MKTKVIFTIMFIACLHQLAAQSKIAEDIKSPGDVKVLLDFPKEGRNTKSGKGFSANIGLLPNGIKRVGLVSFFAFDPGVTKTWSHTSSSGLTTTTTTSIKKRSTAGLAPEIAYGAIVTALDPMIAKFKEFGIDLIMPNQFLDTDEKKIFYNSFDVKHEKFADWLDNMGSGNHDIMYGYPEPFKVIDIVGEPYGN